MAACMSDRLQHKRRTSGKRRRNDTEPWMRLAHWLGVTGLGMLVACAGCARPPDEQAIRDAITRGAQALQQRDAGVLADLVTDDFIGNDELDKAAFGRYLRAHLLAANSIGVELGAVTVEVRGDRASASFEAHITDSSGRWIADRATTLQVETGWRRSGRQWLCNHAKWSSDGR